MEIFILALAIDLIIGDNLGKLHPVVLIGKYISFFEKKLMPSAISHQSSAKKLAGALLTVLVVSTSAAITVAILKLASINQSLYLLISAFILSTTFALRGLLAAGHKVFKALKQQDIVRARNLLGQIVGRDTNDLNQAQIIKATIESLAENTIDSLIAPLFYALIGGPALAIAYRSINTLDSMVGYKNERYNDFGWASARLDDIANYIPARLGLLFVWLATFICRYRFKETVKHSIKDGPRHASPNSGLSEAAFAGALGVQLGGIAYYKGIPRDLPTFGTGEMKAKIGHIKSCLLLVFTSSLLFFASILLFKSVIT